MLRPLILIAVLLAPATMVDAADAKGPAPGKAPGFAQAGKADAQAAFARQAAGAIQPTGTAPGVVGVYVWSGRADENYRPFFQWEFRLKGGNAAAPGLACRITTLSPTKQPLVAGTWKTIGDLAAGASKDIDYKLNCPNFSAYQLEMTWQGGKETWIAWDKFAIPAALGDLGGTSMLVTLNQNFEYADATRIATVTYTIWNLGGQAAREVSQTIHFKDDKGKDVATFDYKPDKGEIPAGYVKDQKVTAPRIPPFATISIGSRLTDAGSLDQGSFTGAKDVEIAKVHAEGKRLKARVRNGTAADLDGVVVTITLQTKDGKAVKSLEMPAGRLAKGEEKDISADIAGVAAWSGYEVGWKSADAPAPAPAAAPAAASAAQVVKVDGVEFAIATTKAQADGLRISGQLSNHRGQELDGLTVVFKVPDGGGKPVPVELKPGRLGVGEELAVDFVAVGVKSFSGLAMEWKTTAAKPAK